MLIAISTYKDHLYKDQRINLPKFKNHQKSDTTGRHVMSHDTWCFFSYYPVSTSDCETLSE